MDQGGRVNLDNVLDQALRNNLKVNIQRSGQKSAEAGVQAAKGQFAPSLTGQLNRYPEGWTNMDGLLALQKTVSWTGTSISLEGGRLLKPDINPAPPAGDAASTAAKAEDPLDRFNGATVRVRQPLLRGADWLANRADIEIGKIMLADAKASTQAEVLEMLRGAESAYWTAAFASDIRQSQAASVERTRAIRKIVALRQAEGQGTSLDVLEAEAAEALARDGEARESKRFQEALGLLWTTAGLKVETRRPDLKFSPLSEAPYLAKAAAPESFVAKALSTNPQPLILANEVTRKQLELRRARNQFLPQVDAEFAYGSNASYAVYHGVNSTAGAAPYEDRGPGAKDEWNVGLKVSFPWPTGTERARVKAAEAALETSHLAREEGLLQLRKEIFQACWEIDASREQIKAGQAGLVANSKKHEFMVARFKEGMSTVRDVMEAENELRRAGETLLEARLRHTLALVLLSRLDGTILPRNGLVI